MGMEIDDALATVGGYRRWQFALFAMTSTCICMAFAWHALGIVNIGWQPPHHCKVDHGPLNESVPYRMGYDGTIQPAQCEVYVNGTNKNETELCRNGWVYHTEYKTIVNEWDLVCGVNYLSELSQTILQVGCMMGELTVACIVDVIGRKKIFMAAAFVIGGFGLGLAFVQSYTAFVIIQAFIGMGLSMNFTAGFLLEMELFDASMRTFVGIGVEFFWVVFYMLLPLLGYIFLDWRHYQIFVSIAAFACLPMFFFIPESPFWLAANRKYDQVEEILQTMARRNGIKLNRRLMDREESEVLMKDNDDENENKNESQGRRDSIVRREEKRLKAQQLKFKDLFVDPKLRIHTLMSMILWFANMVVYYGIILLTPMLAGDRFINTLLGAIVEIPAYIVTYLICLFLGRRLPTGIAHIFAGIFLLAAALTPPVLESGVSLGPLILTFALLAKFSICVSFALIVLYTKELFPTNLRGMSAGVSVFIGRIGAIAAPFAIYAAKSMPWLPNVVLGVISVVAGCMTFILPETRDCALPQDLDDIHAMYGIRPAKRRPIAINT